MFKVLIYNFYVFISIIGLNQITHEKIPLIIDADTANELDDLLIDVRGNKSGIEHLVDSCREVLSIGKTELFENLLFLTFEFDLSFIAIAILLFVK